MRAWKSLTAFFSQPPVPVGQPPAGQPSQASKCPNLGPKHAVLPLHLWHANFGEQIAEEDADCALGSG